MRICLISKEYPPETGWGGIGAYTYQIAHGLAELGHDVEVVSLCRKVGQGTDVQPARADESSEEEGILVHRAQWNGKLKELGAVFISVPYSHFMLKTNLALWSKFAEIHKKKPFDVVEAPEHLAEGLMLALSKTAPLVIKLHTPQSKIIAEKFHNLTASFDQQCIAMLERMAMLESDVLICPSQDLANYVAADLNYSVDSISIVRNPVDANKFCPEGSRAINRDGRMIVQFVGRLEERKGIYFLVEAVPQIVKACPNVHFVIIGSDTNTAKGKKSVATELKKILVGAGVADYVTFVGHVDLSEMPDYYRSADICIAPSLYDNAPYTCLEAMSCGKAFIGTSAGGMREYVVDGESGLIIEPGNASAIAQAVIGLLRDEQRRLLLGQNARRCVLAKFHQTQIARQNIEIYELAGKLFCQGSHSALYRRDSSTFIGEFNDFIYSFNQMLYEFLYVYSWRFRLRHWMRLLLHRPRLQAAKVLVKCARPWLGFSKSGLDKLNQLERQINQIDEERDRLVREQLGCSV